MSENTMCAENFGRRVKKSPTDGDLCDEPPRLPSITRLVRLARALQISVGEFLSRS
jgi:hypothetical protein